MTEPTVPKHDPTDQSPTKVILDPLKRFAGRAKEYARWRPGYPCEAIRAILDGWPTGDPCRVADVGAGTGISSRALALAGWHVWAVEPNDAMRAVGRQSGGDGIRWSDGQGEGTGLDEAAVDAVACFQAFHWLNADRAFAEFRRILDPASPLRRVALIWNEHDHDDATMRAYQAILRRFAVDKPMSGWARPHDVPLERSPLFRNYRRVEFANEQRLDLAGLLGRAFSSSYLPSDAGSRSEIEAALHGLFELHAAGDHVRLAYRTSVHLAELADG